MACLSVVSEGREIKLPKMTSSTEKEKENAVACWGRLWRKKQDKQQRICEKHFDSIMKKYQYHFESCIRFEIATNEFIPEVLLYECDDAYERVQEWAEDHKLAVEVNSEKHGGMTYISLKEEK